MSTVSRQARTPPVSQVHLVGHLRAEKVELLGAGVEQRVEVAVVAELGAQDAPHVRVVPARRVSADFGLAFRRGDCKISNFWNMNLSRS